MIKILNETKVIINERYIYVRLTQLITKRVLLIFIKVLFKITKNMRFILILTYG